jgi:hypothetical protein
MRTAKKIIFTPLRFITYSTLKNYNIKDFKRITLKQGQMIKSSTQK